MKMKKQKISLFIILFLNLVHSQNQTNTFIPFDEKINPPSVTEYEKYEFSSINKSNGTLIINIPIYEINQDGVKIPISLDYTTKGIKVSDDGSWVGLGWDLNFASIYQQINDVDDLKRFNNPNSYKGYLLPHPGNISPFVTDLKFPRLSFAGEIYGSTWLTNGNIPNDQTHCFIATRNMIPLNGNIYHTYGVSSVNSSHPILDIFTSTNDIDTQQDLFTLSLFNETIKFIFNIENGSINQLDNKSFKIIYEPLIESFKIIGPSGEIYFFGLKTKNRSITWSDSFDSITNQNIPSDSYSNQWMITKIITPKKSEINFSYNVNQDSFSSEYGNALNKGKKSETEVNFQLKEDFYGVGAMQEQMDTKAILFGSGIMATSGRKESMTTFYEQRAYITDINFELGKIEFLISDRSDIHSNQSSFYKKLDNIIIKNKNNTIVSDYQFNYSYFISNAVGNNWRPPISEDLSRLKLENINLNNTVFRKFVYNSLTLPPKTSYATDFWGYYNGQVSNNSYVANPARFIAAGIPINSNFFDNGNNHSSNLLFAKACILEEIIFPTVGKEKFIYGLNEYRSTPLTENKVPNFNNSNDIVCGVGLRINEISLYDSENLISKKNYSYHGGNLPNKLSFFKNYISNYRNAINIGSGMVRKKVYEGYEARQHNIYNSPIFINEDKVYYDTVIESFINVFDYNKNYKIKSRFSTNSYHYHQTINNTNFFDLYNPALLDRTKLNNGKLLIEELYDNQEFLIKKTEYNYVFNKSSLFYGVETRNIATWNSYDEPDSTIMLYSALRHGITFYPIYFDSNLLSQETVTEYFPTSNKITKTNYTYNSNNILNSKSIKDNNGNSLYDESTTMLSTPLVINKNILNLPSVTSIYENNRPKTKFIYSYQEINNSTLLSNVEEQSNMNSSTSSKIIYDLYDDKNNLIQFHKEGDIYTSIVWGYNKTLIVAKIENVQYSQIQASLIQAIQNASDTGTEDNVLLALANLRNSLPNSMMTTYTHKPLIGVSSITDTKNDKITYHYDVNNRLEHVRDKEGNILNEYEYHYKTQN